MKKIKEVIENEKKKLALVFPHESKIARHLRDKYKIAVENYEIQSDKYINELTLMENDVDKKKDFFFSPVNANDYVNHTLVNELNNIISIISIHNDFIKEFESNKKGALALILRHYVADYLRTEDYLTKESNSKLASKYVEKCKKVIQKNGAEIQKFETFLKGTVKGQDELNIYLKILFNRDDIKVDVSKDMFVLKRGNQEASNMSEGEKTIIALAYFLTELESLKREGKLKDTIIFFDDPISSLDSNHIFQIRSLIQHFFNDENSYLQLFISTHNFEFFSVLQDCNLFKKHKKDNPKNCRFYLINRFKEEESTIKNLPPSLDNHKSEYAHIFSILKNYNDLLVKDTFEFNVLLPNALRRFLELYTLFKYPKGASGVDERIEEVFSQDEPLFHNTKLYHWFSHQQQFEKISQHDSKLFSIDEAISQVMTYLEEKDPMHWKGLTGEETNLI